MKDQLLELAKSLGNSSRALDDVYSDLVKYPGFTEDMARTRLREIAKDVTKTLGKIEKAGKKI